MSLLARGMQHNPASRIISDSQKRDGRNLRGIFCNPRMPDAANLAASPYQTDANSPIGYSTIVPLTLAVLKPTLMGERKLSHHCDRRKPSENGGRVGV